jgi:hypothetical protein
MAFITDQLRLQLDASNSSSYSGSGTTWTDLSGNGYNATLTNGPTYSSDFGGIINFDGTNDYATIPFNSDFAASQTVSKTVQAWVRFDAMETRYFLGNLRGSATFDGWLLGTTSTGQLRFLTNANSEVINNTAINTVATNTWYLVTAIFRLTNTVGDIQIYLNNTNVLSGRHGTIATFTTGAPFQIGTSLGDVAGQDLYFDGSIGSVYSYNKALSAQEISDNYDATFARFSPVTNINITETPATASALAPNSTESIEVNKVETPATATALMQEPTIVIVANNNTQITTSFLASATIPQNIISDAIKNVNNVITEVLTASTELVNNVIISTGTDDSVSAAEFIASAEFVEPRVSEVPFIASATMPNASAAVEESYFALVKELNPYFYINSGTGVSTTINYGYQTGTITKGTQLLTSQDGGYPLNATANAFSWKGAQTNNADNRLFFETTSAANSFDNLIGTGNFAYEVWTRPLSFPDNQLTANAEPQQSIFKNDNLEVYLDDYHTTQSNIFPFTITSFPRSIKLKIRNATSSFDLQSSGLDASPLSLNNWNHIVVNVYQSGINANERLVQLWINGQVIFNSNISFTPWTTTETLSTVLGSKSIGLSYMFDTFADELAIYAQPLTNSQIIEHYQFISTLSPDHFEFTESFTAIAESGDHNFIVISNAIISETPATATTLFADPSVLAVRNKSITADIMTASALNTDVTVYWGWTIYPETMIAAAESKEGFFLSEVYYNYVQTNIAPYRYVTFDAADSAFDYGTDNDYSVVPTIVGGAIVSPEFGINGKSAKTAGTSYVTDGVILKESEWNDSWGTGANDWHSAFWFQRALDDNSTTGLRVLWNLNSYKDNEHGVLYQYQGKLHMQFNNGSGTFTETDSTALDLFDYNRHFVVIDHNHGGGNNNTVKLYVDSILRFTVNIGSITPTTTNAATADSGPNNEANNRPRLSIGCLITPFGSTALPVAPANTKLIIDEVYWDKNSITSTMVTNLFNVMPDKNNKIVVVEPMIASDEFVMPAFSTSSILASSPLTASASLVQPGITADRQVIAVANVMTATALAGNATVFENRIITADLFIASATFNDPGVLITIPAQAMLATAKIVDKNFKINGWSIVTMTPYVRYLRISNYENRNIKSMKEIK